jgi:hypothetical protein
MKREYIPYSTVRDNSFKLAYRIFNSGFTPDIIYVCLRGGVYIGNIISEFFKIIRKGSAPFFYAAMNHLVNCVTSKGIPVEDIRVAVHNYKIKLYLEKKHPVTPDFYAQVHTIDRPEDDIWIHYLSHEIIGFTRKNLFDFFPTADEEVKRALSVLKDFL